MRHSYIRAAFEKLCHDKQETDEHYVALVESIQRYGGPEEGGWWYTQRFVVEYQKFATKEIADRVAEAVTAHAKELSADAHVAHARHCSDSMDWLEARGLEADYLPEPDGPTEYHVIVCKELPTYDNRRPSYE